MSIFGTRALAILVLVALTGLAAPDAWAENGETLLLQEPTISKEHVVFVYAQDLWIVGRGGGTARRLTSHAGRESGPRLSPDGRWVAFTGEYEGNADVYVISVDGGTPKRLTWHPGTDSLRDWHPDGKRVLFSSSRDSGAPVRRLFLASVDGGMPEPLSVPRVGHAAYDASAARIAYTPMFDAFRTWKRYRGGLAPDIWLFDLESREARNLTASDANELQPMWHGDTLYYLADRGPQQRYNLWAHDLATGTDRQVTHFTDVDVTFPAIGPADIVFQAGGRLHRLALATEAVHELAIEAVTDLATLKPRAERVGDLVSSAGISPSGKRAVVSARGELFTLPAEHGVVRQLSHRPGSAELFPAWSPDGRWIAYWSDASGEYELTLKDARGEGEERTVTALGPGYRYQPFWSPDSTRIAFIDHSQTIRVLEVESGALTEVDRALHWIHPQLAGFELSWSADSRWLAYARDLETGPNAVFLYRLEDGERHQVTAGYYSDTAPVFDPDGDYLYYRSNRSLEPVYSDLDATWVYPNTTSLVAVPLRADVASPLAPRNDEESVTEENGDGEDGEGDQDGKDGKDDDEAEDDDSDQEDRLEIDLDGFEARAIVLPPPAGNYGVLRATSGKLVYQRYPRSGSADEQSPIALWDFEAREEQTVLGDAEGYELSADGKKLLVVQRGWWAITDLGPNAKTDQRLAIDSLEAMIDPRQEWRQLFNEVWRTYRDVFYDPGLHGLDWAALRARYSALLDDAVTRWDVNAVLGELIAEVNASHTYVGGGDTEDQERRQTGLLGVDWALENGAYRIARIVRGAPWDAETRSPLAEPGLEVAEGDYVLAVNGVPIDVAEEPYAAFAGLAGATVLLTVNDAPTLDGAREVLVETVADERRLRNRAWVEANRRRVEEATGGRVGYVHVPDTSINGQTELVRQFNSQATKAGLIIDERFNRGGQLPDRFVELMSRQRVAHLFFRYGGVVPWPSGTHYGPKVMLINGWAGSGGDAFPWFFREMEAGPLIGERTWGGLIGPAVGHSLIDGGGFTSPPGRLFGTDGRWFAEGHGVEPDIPVVDDPGELANGRDPQLEAAIAEVLRLLETEAQPIPEQPPFEPRVPAAAPPPPRGR